MEFLKQYFMEISLGLFAVALLISIINMAKLNKLNKKYKSFMDALSGRDVEKLLTDHMEMVQKVSENNSKVLDEIRDIKLNMKTCVQKFGIVRYTAFEDVGSDLSFALALLDGKDDGVVVNGIYSREGSTVYAKPIHGGEAKHKLSDEEQKAIENAKRRGQA